jgi:predicted O-linked N-acetylglucosamine transferase (SPINDLY family)
VAATNLRVRRDFAEAEAIYRRLVSLKSLPDGARARYLCDLAQLLEETGRVDDAVATINKALALDPGHGGAYTFRGMIAAKRNDVVGAMPDLEKGYRLAPNIPWVMDLYATGFAMQGRLREMIEVCEKILEINPNYIDTLARVSSAYYLEGYPSKAIDTGRRLVKLAPDDCEGYGKVAAGLVMAGKIEEAIEAFRDGVARDLKRGNQSLWCNYVFTLHYSDIVEPAQVFAEHRRFATEFAAHRVPAAFTDADFNNDRDPHRRLRIGYLSPDFRVHSVASFIEPILTYHNRKQVQVIAFHVSTRKDHLTDRFRTLADTFLALGGATDDDIVAKIREEKIDILVDLAGHTGENRTIVLARRPAPILITYLGYPGTTGLDTVNYRFTDAWADPEGVTDELHTEELVRLPTGFLTFQPSSAPPLTDAPASKNGFITFGCFNNLPKVTPTTMRLWASVLKAIPDARLVVKNRSFLDQETREETRLALIGVGVDPERLDLLEWIDGRRDHLQAYHLIDVALDTYPYHGTTTTCEALWMGVPVITLAGPMHTSRVGVSLLSQIEMPELIAQNPDEFVEIAQRLASDIPAIESLRQDLRVKMLGSPLFDYATLARNFEVAFRAMWHHWLGFDEDSPPDGADA